MPYVELFLRDASQYLGEFRRKLQQDGAPPHWDAIVRSSLNNHFTERWMGTVAQLLGHQII